MIFDFDGTLADTFPVFQKSYAAVASRWGLKQLDHDEIRYLRTLSTRDILKHIHLPIWKLPRVTTDFQNAMNDNASQIRTFDGITEIIRSLRNNGMLLALATSNTRAVVDNTLGRELSDCFELIESGATVFGKAKLLKRILRKTGVDNRQAIYIGDETRDALAAEKASVSFGAVAWGYNNVETLLSTHPAKVFLHPRNLTALIVRD